MTPFFVQSKNAEKTHFFSSKYVNSIDLLSITNVLQVFNGPWRDLNKNVWLTFKNWNRLCRYTRLFSKHLFTHVRIITLWLRPRDFRKQSAVRYRLVFFFFIVLFSSQKVVASLSSYRITTGGTRGCPRSSYSYIIHKI